MTDEKTNKAHRFLSMFVDWKKVATTLLLGGVTVIYSGAGWVWHQFIEHQKQIQDLTNELKLYQANVLPEQQELVRRNLHLEKQLDALLLEYRMLRYQVEWHHQAPQPTKKTDPKDPTKPPKQPIKLQPDFEDWLKRYAKMSAREITPEDIKKFREQAQQIPNLPYPAGGR